MVRPRILQALLLFMAVAQTSLFCASDNIEDELNSAYGGKVLTLRHSYEGNHLSFESDGTLVGAAALGPWTLNSQVAVERVTLKERSLQIHARRICLVFDSKAARPYRDVLQLLAESRRPNRDAVKKMFRDNKVEIDIALTSANPTEQDVDTAVKAVFLAPSDSIRDVVPEFWRGYFNKLDSLQDDAGSSEVVYSATAGEASPPRVLYQADPEFSDAARRASYGGTMELSVVVDPSGSVRDVQITSPLGMGLDEKAVEAVKTWRFEPGMRNAEPVPVKIGIEVSFYLY